MDADMIDYVQEWLQRTIAKVDALLMEVCWKFEAEKYKVVSQHLMSHRYIRSVLKAGIGNSLSISSA